MELVRVALPFGRGHVVTDLPAAVTRVLAPQPWPRTPMSEADLVTLAIEQPVAGPPLCDLARDASHLVVITSDHTRALPSRITLPPLLAEARRHRPDLAITLLVGTGLHRAPTVQEARERFGPDILVQCRLQVHDATSAQHLVDLGVLSTGTRLLVNRAVAEADLVVAEGLIEPHFFAGYSGGRKSVLPATSGAESIYQNHRPRYIDHPCARNGVLDGNPVHEESLEAARRARLAFILNVVVSETRTIVAAVAGDLDAAHRAGVAVLAQHAVCPAHPAEIALVSNAGYPLDRDLYQSVKGLAVAADAVVRGGTIILVAECCDGIGHADFFGLASRPAGPRAILEAIRGGNAPARDAWQVQVLARVLEDARVIVVSRNLDPRDVRAMHMDWAPDLPAALAVARVRYGSDGRINVIPEGPATVIVPLEDSGAVLR